MEPFSLTCLGVGDGMPNADRNHSSYLYQFGETTLLVDCGEPVGRSCRAAGIDKDAIDRLLLSHLHSDHFGGLFMFLQGLWLEKRRKPLPINLPADGIQPIRQMLHLANLVPELLRFGVEMEPWKAGQPIIQGKVRVTPYPTTHLESLRQLLQAKYPGQYAAYCFLLEHEGRRIGHSADLGAPSDLDPLLLHPLDLLVCELSHFKIPEICAYLRDKPIKKVLFTHLSRHYWEDFEGTRQEVKRLLPGMNVVFAWDGDVVML